MTQAEIKAQIEKLSSRLTLASLPDSAKASISKRLNELKAELEASKQLEEKPTVEEKKVETEVKEAVKEEQKVVSQADEEIKRIEKSLSNPTLPESAKAVLRSKLASLKQGLKESAKESTVEKKVVEKAEKEVEKAEKEVKKAKTPAKAKAAVEKVRQARKKRTEAKKSAAKKSSKRTTKVKTLLQQLQAMMKKDESLKKRYKTAKKSGSVDLKRDADKKAMKPGRRISQGLTSNKTSKKGKNKGHVYYEYRFNRSDKQKSKYPYFQDGGEVMGEKKKLSKYAKGGLLDSVLEQVSSSYIGSRLDDFGYENALNYKNIDSVRSNMIQVLTESGDRPYSIHNLNELISESAKTVLGSPMSIRKEVDETFKDVMARGGSIKVGTFDETQLRRKEDKLAVEKVMKESGLKYVDTKIIKKGGKMYMEVYLIPDEDYLASKKFNDGGSIDKPFMTEFSWQNRVEALEEKINRLERNIKMYDFEGDKVSMRKEENKHTECEEELEELLELGEKFGYEKKEYARGGTLQNKRPYNRKGTYSKKADEDDKAKRVGYRFTDKKAKRLGIKNPNRKPTEEQIRKYNRNGVYWENRIDKSDVSRMKRLQDGGILSPMTGGVDADFRFDMLSPNF